MLRKEGIHSLQTEDDQRIVRLEGLREGEREGDTKRVEMEISTFDVVNLKS